MSEWHDMLRHYIENLNVIESRSDPAFYVAKSLPCPTCTAKAGEVCHRKGSDGTVYVSIATCCVRLEVARELLSDGLGLMIDDPRTLPPLSRWRRLRSRAAHRLAGFLMIREK